MFPRLNSFGIFSHNLSSFFSSSSPAPGVGHSTHYLEGTRFSAALSASVALLLLFLSCYSCKFVRVTESGQSPFFMGVWNVEGEVVNGNGYVFNANQCIAWTDTPYYDDRGVRTAKVFAVLATLGATALWAHLVRRVVAVASRKAESPSSSWIVRAGAVSCAVSGLLLYSVYAVDICDVDGLECHWGAASYLCFVDVLAWLVTAWFIRKEDKENAARSQTKKSLLLSAADSMLPGVDDAWEGPVHVDTTTASSPNDSKDGEGQAEGGDPNVLVLAPPQPPDVVASYPQTEEDDNEMGTNQSTPLLQPPDASEMIANAVPSNKTENEDKEMDVELQ